MTDRERHEDETLKNCIQEAYGCSDDQLLAELAEIDKTLSESDLPGVEDRIMSRLKARMAEEETEKEIEVNPEADKVSVAQVEESESETTTEVETAPCVEVQEKKVVRIGKKKIALVAVLAAAFVGVLGVSASGGKMYFLKRDEQKINVVLDSGNAFRDVGSIEEAYQEAKIELGFEILKMKYIPKNWIFKKLEIASNKAVFVFENGEELVYFIQTQDSREQSVGINSDRKESETSYFNKWLEKEITIEENILEDGKSEYSALVYVNEVSYRIIGKMSKEELEKIVTYLTF